MINISEFITGVKEKYPTQLLKGRIEYEGNVISCLFKDMLLLDDTTFEQMIENNSQQRRYSGLKDRLLENKEEA